MMKEIFHRGPISCGVDANPLLNYESGILAHNDIVHVVHSYIAASAVLCQFVSACLLHSRRHYQDEGRGRRSRRVCGWLGN